MNRVLMMIGAMAAISTLAGCDCVCEQQPVTAACKADMDGSGQVAGTDIPLFQGEFGERCDDPIPLKP